MWTYSIEYDDDRTGRRMSTMIAAATARQALEEFWRARPDVEIVEMRRVRHD